MAGAVTVALMIVLGYMTVCIINNWMDNDR